MQQSSVVFYNDISQQGMCARGRLLNHAVSRMLLIFMSASFDSIVGRLGTCIYEPMTSARVASDGNDQRRN
jgi:hypothetical protein